MGRERRQAQKAVPPDIIGVGDGYPLLGVIPQIVGDLLRGSLREPLNHQGRQSGRVR